jgi:hypothetical protein
MKRVSHAILRVTILAYAFIVTFILADGVFDLTGLFRPGKAPSLAAIIAIASSVALVGTMHIWLVLRYLKEAEHRFERLVVCAWTHRVKQGDQWLSLEDFLHQQLGYRVSHGLCEEAYGKLREEMASAVGSPPDAGAATDHAV